MCIFKSIMHWTNNHPSISTPLYKPPDCRRPQTTCIQASVSPTLCCDECSLYSHYGKKAWKLLKLKLAEIAQIFGVIWNKMALDPSERWIYRVISVSCTQLSLPNMPFFFSFITFFFSVSLHSFSFHPRFFVFSMSFFASLPKRVLPCSLFECFSFSGCSGWKVRDVRVKSTSLLLCVCVCACVSPCTCVSEQSC